MSLQAKARPLEGAIRRLRLCSSLDGEDEEALHALKAMVLTRDRFAYLMRPGDEPSHALFLVSGFVERHRTNFDGGKQILNFYVPGDPLNLECLLDMPADDALQATQVSVVALVQNADLRDLMDRRPKLRDAIFRSLMVDASIFREWTVNVGQRDAQTRIAHLLCELSLRLETAGFDCRDVPLPLNQSHLADATGLTTVHVNRTLKKLQSERHIEVRGGQVFLPDWRELAAVGGFSPGYLHIPDPWKRSEPAQ